MKMRLRVNEIVHIKGILTVNVVVKSLNKDEVELEVQAPRNSLIERTKLPD